MQIDSQTWMQWPAVAAVFDALQGDEDAPVARFVGGCVRDAILVRPITDIDVATTLPPDEVMARLAAAAVKCVPTGLAHGTVTAVASEDKRVVEITTLRRDVETYGRHAKVAFTDDWAEDAARRDFTINALSADRNGTVFDYYGGVEDLRAGRIRFVGAPAERIAEDYLRLLRFFRFFAAVGRPPADADALVACREAAAHIGGLSGERIAKELLALLGVDDPAPTLALMAGEGILAHIDPHLSDTGRASAVAALERRLELNADPVRRLAGLIDDAAPEGGALVGESVAARLRLSNADRARIAACLAPDAVPDTTPDNGPDAAIMPGLSETAAQRALYRSGPEAFVDRVLIGGAGGADGGGVGRSRAGADRPARGPRANLAAPDISRSGPRCLGQGCATGTQARGRAQGCRTLVDRTRLRTRA